MRASLILISLLAALSGGSSLAADYPVKPVRLIVGYGPGGGNDIVGRMIAAKFTEFLGQPVVVENKPGADTIVASDYVAKSPADGYTLLLNAMGGFTITPALHSKLPYDPLRDFIPVGTIAMFPYVLAVNSTIPAKSVSDLVAYAKANPGKLNYGDAATAVRMATEMFTTRMGINLTRVSYKGSGQSSQALLANEIQVVVSDATGMVAYEKAGQVRYLAVTTAERAKTLPGVPAMSETPGLDGYDFAAWIGLFVPAGTPPAIVQALNAGIVRAAGQQDFRERLNGMGADPVGDSPSAAAARVRLDLQRNAEAARRANLTVD